MVIAEFFTSISGLGAIIITSANNFDTATTFVPIIRHHADGGGAEFRHRGRSSAGCAVGAEIAGRDQQ